ncbi:MAG: hypothetical protein JJE35_01100 [Thermoleophilia bacterium]|nr:hypothetical protein [Thermoleophilia bacterium]
MTRNSRIGLFGTAALGFSVVYFASDLIEAVRGGFSTPQLLMTFVAEAVVAATQGAPDALQLLAVGLRDAGFAGMGLCLIGGVRSEAQERPGDALSPEVDQPEVEQREVARADRHPGRGAGRALTSGAHGA